MDNLLNNLVIYKTKYHSGLVDEPSLTQALMAEPAQMSPVISQIFGRFDQGNVIDYITNGMGRTMEIENSEFRWKVAIDHDLAITIMNATWQGDTIASTDTPGLNNTPIQLTLEKKWFGPGAIIEFDDKEFQASIVGEPYQDGPYFVYTVVCADGRPESFIPPSLLEKGKQVSRVGSAYSEHSDQADIFNYQYPFELRNKLTIMRASYDITRSAKNTVMVVEFKDPKTGKSTKYHSVYQEWVALRQWYERLDYMGLYSKYNTQEDGTVGLVGENGREVNIGAGILEQISPANKFYYTNLSLDLLDNALSDLSYNILGFGERKFVGITGEMGMRELDRILKDKASSYTLVDSVFITGKGQELKLGGMFTTYEGPTGVSFTLKHLPAYDNPVHNRKLHPITGKPLESYRITILNYGMKDGESNIKKVVRKGSEFTMWYTAGSTTPGPNSADSSMQMRSNAKDGYEVHFLSECGYQIVDPTSCAEFICDAE